MRASTSRCGCGRHDRLRRVGGRAGDPALRAPACPYVSSPSLRARRAWSTPRGRHQRRLDLGAARRCSASSRRANVSRRPAVGIAIADSVPRRRGATGLARHAWRGRTARWRPSGPHHRSHDHASQRCVRGLRVIRRGSDCPPPRADPVHGMCTRTEKLIMTGSRPPGGRPPWSEPL